MKVEVSGDNRVYLDVILWYVEQQWRMFVIFPYTYSHVSVIV